jgi:putative flippase GtrA
MTRIRYLIVGATCALLHNAIIIGLDQLGVHYVFATCVSFVIVVSVGYLLHCAFTFSAQRSLASFGRYIIAMAANLPLSIVALFLFHDLCGLDMAIASPAATVTLVVLNYLLSAWAILGGRAEPKPGEIEG